MEHLRRLRTARRSIAELLENLGRSAGWIEFARNHGVKEFAEAFVLVDAALDVATPPRAAMRVAMVDLRSWKRAKGGRRRVRPRGGGLERETIRLKLKLEL